MKDDHSSEWGDDGNRALDSPNDGEQNSRKRKEKQEPVEEPLEDVNSLKKARVVWSVELHQQFVNAVNQLGIDSKSSSHVALSSSFVIHAICVIELAE